MNAAVLEKAMELAIIAVKQGTPSFFMPAKSVQYRNTIAIGEKRCGFRCEM